jgi:glycosyltransferase involved in cell wall biosynthesis
LDGTLPARLWWQRIKMPRLVQGEVDVLFVPGGSYGGDFAPFVTMFQNMLPFDRVERHRYGVSWASCRLMLLERLQMETFRRAAGVIFLNAYAQAQVTRVVKDLHGRSAIIPHGVAHEFFRNPRKQEAIHSYSNNRPFSLLYVSTVDLYKHQWHVVEAVGQLRRAGLPVELKLVGGAYPPALRRLRAAIRRVDLKGEFIHYTGPVHYSRLPELYHAADGFVFASTCENLPNILLEAMASGLPIACSSRDPMPGILGEGGFYFDPEQPGTIAESLHALLTSTSAREDAAVKAYGRAQSYSWSLCAASTFSFLTKTVP